MLYSKIVSGKYEENLQTMQYLFYADKNKDIVFREFAAGDGTRCFIVFIDGMADSANVNDFIIRPLMIWDKKQRSPGDVLQTNTLQPSTQMDDAVAAVLAGDTAVFIDGDSQCYICETKGFDKRSVTTPTIENTVKGSQEAFTEAIRTNTTLLHRILRTRHLVTEFIKVGEVTHDTCAVMYLDNIVNKKILAEVKRRLSSIQADNIMGSGMVEQLIEDSPNSLFPTLLSTERPERAAHYLTSGRVAVVVDGSPFVIIVPVTFALLLDSPEGNSQRWQNGTFSRLLRLFALFCTTMLSGGYLALILYHREIIPTPLLGAIMDARQNIPFPSVFEVLVMELFFELVRESVLRIPSMLGSTIGIVGALIMGQAAVEANLVSPITLIVVALSGIGNVALPDYDLAFGIRVIKLLVILMSASFGLLGLSVAVMIVFSVLANQNSFGVPMLSIQSLSWKTGAPLCYQIPLWKQERRPSELKTQRPRQEPPISRPWVYHQDNKG